MASRRDGAPKRLRVYVAGPISKGDVPANIRAGIDAGLRLLTAGYAPMIPHLSALVEPDALIGTPRYEDWMETDFAWIAAADALVRIPGDSAGADREIEHAEKHGVPVFYGVDAFLARNACAWDSEGRCNIHPECWVAHDLRQRAAAAPEGSAPWTP
jgi:hypothetical protein